jgi:hypothetical protein
MACFLIHWTNAGSFSFRGVTLRPSLKVTVLAFTTLAAFSMQTSYQHHDIKEKKFLKGRDGSPSRPGGFGETALPSGGQRMRGYMSPEQPDRSNRNGKNVGARRAVP